MTRCLNKGGGYPCPDCGGYHAGPMPEPLTFPNHPVIPFAPAIFDDATLARAGFDYEQFNPLKCKRLRPDGPTPCLWPYCPCQPNTVVPPRRDCPWAWGGTGLVILFIIVMFLGKGVFW